MFHGADYLDKVNLKIIVMNCSLRIFTLLLSLLLLAGYSHAQGIWTGQTSGTNKTLYALDFANDNDGWAVGFSGTVIGTQDGGNTWNSLPSGTGKWLLGVHFPDSLHGYAVGVNAIIYTNNGGTSWITLDTISGNWYYTPYFLDANTGWICGKNGLVLGTTNAGISWNSYNTGGDEELLSTYFLDQMTGWVCGGLGVIFKTTDGGVTWTPQNSGTSVALESIVFTDANNGWIAGDSSIILHTTDGGATWNIQNIDAPGDRLEIIDFPDVNHGLAVGGNGTVLFTNDGGATWSQQNSGTNEFLFGVSFINAGKAWACGTNGTMLQYDDPTSDIFQTSNDPGIQLKPNPGSEQIIVQTTSNEMEKMTISIYNINGELTHTQTIFKTETIIRTDDLPNGIYFVEVQIRQNRFIEKLIIQH
ncbi:MAG: T9SS C-terminal target domain-containing protein [Bacteroidetes bacterium]|nr:MAG: T9SS C-terminal target domain-containing protein [Bacteroidota bacterium]